LKNENSTCFAAVRQYGVKKYFDEKPQKILK